ncbi:DUF3558 family protein [Dactylosporangium sp. NPDC049525]|uniref:DUF3558 family protein n=1 Tax=Dactylosporangium sp. NPDC049525 TaxID=3154730 RepID=UPI003415A0B1
MRKLAAGVAAGLIVLAAATGCGGDPAPSSTRDTPGAAAPPAVRTTVAQGDLPDACALLSLEEAGALLGKAVKPPQPALDVIGADEAGCDWQKADEDNFRLALIQFSVYRSERYLPRDAYKPGEIIGDVTIAGAPGTAFLTRSGKTTVGVNYAVKGRRVTIDVTVDDGDPTARVDAITKTAALVATRL